MLDIKLGKDQLIDEFNNTSHISYWGSEEAARQALESLMGCTYCTDCEGCADCTDCTRCRSCTDCNHCTLCNNCNDCTCCHACIDYTDRNGQQVDTVEYNVMGLS